MHERVFAVLALGVEPVDPTLRGWSAPEAAKRQASRHTMLAALGPRPAASYRASQEQA